MLGSVLLEKKQWCVQKLYQWFRPHDTTFLHLLEELSRFGEPAAALLYELLMNPWSAACIHKRLKEVEVAADECAEAIYKRLRKSATPHPDPEDIKAITRCLENGVVDIIESVGKRFALLARHNNDSFINFKPLFSQTVEQVAILRAATSELPKAIAYLARLELPPDLKDRIHKLENDADALWEGQDGVLDAYYGFVRRSNIIQTHLQRVEFLREWKEIAHSIEQCIDNVRATVDIVLDIIEKHPHVEIRPRKAVTPVEVATAPTLVRQ